MGTENVVTETAVEKARRRTGACIVKSCDCSEFAYDKNLDGFRSCQCAHTQHAHEFGDAT